MGLDQQPVEMQKGRDKVQIPEVILSTQHIPAEVCHTRLDRLNLWEAKLTIQKWKPSRINGTFNFKFNYKSLRSSLRTTVMLLLHSGCISLNLYRGI